ncbi:MAG: hypothetical protein ACRCZR_05860 [Cetobacterium sp.]
MNRTKESYSAYDKVDSYTRKANEQKIRRARKGFSNLGMEYLEKMFETNPKGVRQIMSELIVFLDDDSKISKDNFKEGQREQHIADFKKFRNKSKLKSMNSFLLKKLDNELSFAYKDRVEKNTRDNLIRMRHLLRDSLDPWKGLLPLEKTKHICKFILGPLEEQNLEKEERNFDFPFGSSVNGEINIESIDKILYIAQSLDLLKEALNQMVVIYLSNQILEVNKREKILEEYFRKIYGTGKELKRKMDMKYYRKNKKYIKYDSFIQHEIFDFTYLYETLYSDELAFKAQSQILKDELRADPSIVSQEKATEIYKKGMSQNKEVIDGIKENRFKERIKKIQAVIEFYKTYYRRNLDFDNIKNLKGMYFEIYLSDHKYEFTEKKVRVKTLVDEIYKLISFEEGCSAYDNIIFNKQQTENGDFVDVGFIPREDRQKIHEESCDYNKKIEKILKDREIDFAILGEKITRGNYLVEGVSLNEYNLIKGIEVQIYKELRYILSVFSVDAKLEFVDKITRELLLKLEEVIQNNNLSDMSVFQMKDIANK